MNIKICNHDIKKALISSFGECAKNKEISEYTENNINESLEWYLKGEDGNLKTKLKIQSFWQRGIYYYKEI